MRRFFLALLVAVLAGTLGACDFSPTYDVPLPEFEPSLTINGVLAADSTVEVRVTTTRDRYLSPHSASRGFEPSDLFTVPDGAVVELLVDGASAGDLRLEPRLCNSDDRFNDPNPMPEARCGAFVSDVVVEPGRTYAVRASAPGFPPAEASVTVPDRVPVRAEVSPPVEVRIPGWIRVDRDVSVTLQDLSGAGDRYALMAVSGPWSYTRERRICDSPETPCRDTTWTVNVPQTQFSYRTTDPVLLTAARTIPTNGINFVTFTDEVFDGAERTFEITVGNLVNPDRDDEGPTLEAVWVVAVDDATFGAYQVAWFGYPAGDDFNPFQEPLNLPSNVEGGYGVLGAVTVNEVRFDEE
ncbi:DUF4249 domain-containing protein [Rubrivirga sp.]|uniref:DUF4249 domain-containing protein n=1 Tax=Rubrivirga sp. TaxID=1885344 RepID=UPI003C737EDB